MDDEASDSKKISNLEQITTSIEVRKFGKPILNLAELGYLSIRNPSAFIYKDKIGLLYTVRTSQQKSALHLAWSKNGKDFNLEHKPFIRQDSDSQLATEDARITKIKDEYWINFTSVKEISPEGNCVLRIGHAKTKDFKTHYYRQIILDGKRENKNSLFFKNGKYYFVVDRPFMKDINETPGAEIAEVKRINPLVLGEPQPYLFPTQNPWENARVGINTPPIRIKHETYGNCLFMLYHGARKNPKIYSMGYIIAEEKNPLKILERSKEPLITPELNFEKGTGVYSPEIPNVIFGCGAVPISNNTLRFYYSGADKYPSFADITLHNAEIIDEIFNPKTS